MVSIRTGFCMLLCAFVLSACATTAGTPIYTPPVGSQVSVIQELGASGRGRVMIQDGRVLTRKDINVLNPYCQFTVRRQPDQDRDSIVVSPGVFTVTKSYRQRDMTWAEGLQFAGRAGSDRTMSTVMELSSADQPHVTSLGCARWGGEYDNGWVTIPEMRSALSGLVEITLAE